jgi:hypothetical protein
MALQLNSGPGLPLWGFVTEAFSQGWIVSPASKPQLGWPGLWSPETGWSSYTPRHWLPHLSRLLRHEWVTVGLFFNPGHHTGESQYHFSVISWLVGLWGRDSLMTTDLPKAREIRESVFNNMSTCPTTLISIVTNPFRWPVSSVPATI